MPKILSSESEMIKYGNELAARCQIPGVIELIGDVGSGKTTITKGIAKGLNITEPVTSPSFTISKLYDFQKNQKSYILAHYDFYRLSDPGIMQETLQEDLSSPHTLTVIEWADSVADFLPPHRLKITISLQPDGSRKIIEEKL